MLIDFNTLFPKYGILPKGVVHIGASTGQESKHYVNLGVKDVVYIEALPDVFEQLVNNCKSFKGTSFKCINVCISEQDGEEVIFNRTNNEGQSSSILELGTHKIQHPSVKVIERLKLTTSRVDTLFKKYNIKSDHNFLNIDLQGAELIALKSMGDLLKGFQWAYLEVNKEELYKGCALVEEVDIYMAKFGFERIETKWTPNAWGDALFAKV
jgi:FkbM family methyltransferase